MILCSEKCFYEEDGLCTLKEAKHPSSTPIEDCPYFESKVQKKEELPSSKEDTSHNFS